MFSTAIKATGIVGVSALGSTMVSRRASSDATSEKLDTIITVSKLRYK